MVSAIELTVVAKLESACQRERGWSKDTRRASLTDAGPERETDHEKTTFRRKPIHADPRIGKVCGILAHRVRAARLHAVG